MLRSQISPGLFPVALLLIAAIHTSPAHAQIEFTEVMHSPGGSDAIWEWVEVRNTSAAAVDLDGWVIDDDDNGNLGGVDETPNIYAGDEGYNTVVPAGGVAVLYPGDELDFDTLRFTDAWGSGITLIPVRGLTALTDADSIGLWPSYNAYLDDFIEESTTSPRRTFTNAVASIDYSGVEYTGPDGGHSIAWDGTGSAGNAADWRVSALGQPNVVESVETVIESAQINDTADRGNPGAVPGGPAASGLLISEIMFAPESPLVAVGYNTNDFEWVEIVNNTGSAIDFQNTPYVFDDDDGGALDAANVDSGALGVGEVGVLFHNDVITETDMEVMWGDDVKFLPVAEWPSLNNSGGDTIALWDSFSEYEADSPEEGDRTQDNAVATVTYNTLAGEGWPTINTGDSIFLRHLDDDPAVPESWMRAGTNEESLSINAMPIFQSAVDHPGGDVGSPGFAPSTVASVPGDYNQNGVVDAADYTYWRDRLGQNTPLPNTNPADTDGEVTGDEYDYWVSRFGATSGGSSIDGGAVPEPAWVLLVATGALLAWPRRGGR